MNFRPALFAIPVLTWLFSIAIPGSGHAADPVVDNLAAPYLTGDALDTPGFGTAQAFTTGGTDRHLVSIAVRIDRYQNSVVAVKLWSGSGTVPVAVVEDLGTRSVNTPFTDETVSFLSTTRPLLKANTRYWVSVANVSGDFDWTITASGANLNGDGTIDNLTRETSNGGTTWGGSGGDYRRFAVSVLVSGELDTGFNTPSGFMNYVVAVVPLPDGKLLVGGFFFDMGGDPNRDWLIRLLPDGMLDSSFNPPAGLNDEILSIVSQADGKILVGGLFTDVGGDPDRNRLIRLHPDGTLDSSFTPPAGLNHRVDSIVTLADGKLLVGGAFTDVGGDPNRDRLIRLHPDGTLDPSFTATADLNGEVISIVPLADGKLLVGGYFINVGGNPNRNRLIRLQPDGTLDTSFNAPADLNGGVLSIVPQSDGKLLVGGAFTNVGDDPNRDRLIRLEPDGTLDLSFTAPAGLNSLVYTVVTQADGKILVGGNFFNVGDDSNRNSLIRLHPDGTLDASFVAPAGLNGFVSCMVPMAEGKLVVGGSSFDVGGDPNRDQIFRTEYESGTRAISVPNLQTIRWTAAGSTPEPYRVAFEASTDGGASFVPLGEGRRVAGGWEYRGSNIPAIATIRTRALVRTGGYNGSILFLEDTLAISKTAAPRLTLTGKKKITTSRGSVSLRGRATDPDGDVRLVQFKDSSPKGKRFRKARGTTNWQATAKLKSGRNTVVVQAIDSRGAKSVPLRVTVIKK